MATPNEGRSIMSSLEWTSEFETGIDYIDYEHRRLLELVNRICGDLVRAGSENTVGECLGELYAEGCGHFALEERLMREKKYGLYELHKAHHEQLLEELRYMMDAYEDGTCETCGKTLEECLTSWFYKHFQTKDGRLQTLRT
jgi:hemerythrin